MGYNYRTTLLVKKDKFKKSWLNVCVCIYIYIYIYENFDDRLLVEVEFKFLKLRW